jgi:hypothetical protein
MKLLVPVLASLVVACASSSGSPAEADATERTEATCTIGGPGTPCCFDGDQSTPLCAGSSTCNFQATPPTCQ